MRDNIAFTFFCLVLYIIFGAKIMLYFEVMNIDYTLQTSLFLR